MDENNTITSAGGTDTTTTTNNNNVDNNVLERAADFWQHFDIDSRRAQWDKLQIEISEYSDKSIVSRKKLAVDTKSFKQLTENEAKIQSIKPLLKSYQMEIDSLTKRARFAEGVFLDLYKSLYDAPNPAPLLKRSASSGDQVGTYVDRIKQLESEISEYEAEFSSLQNQDITIRSLESEIESLKKQLQEQLEAAVEAKESDMMNVWEERSKKFIENEESLKNELDELASKNSELAKETEKYQEDIFELRSAMEEMDAAKQSEIDILGEDLQRANEDIDTLKMECEQLRREKEEALSSFAANERSKWINDHEVDYEQDRKRVLELEDELIRKQELEEDLRLQVGNLQASMKDQIEKHELEMLNLQKKVESLNEDAFNLKVELKGRPTHETVKKLKAQLQMLQAVDIGDEELVKKLKETSQEGENEEFDNTILLHGRIRKLESISSTLRVELAECKSQLESALHEKSNAEERLRDQQELVHKLEKGTQLLAKKNSNQIGEEDHSLYSMTRSNNNNNNNDNNVAAHLMLAATENVTISSSGNQLYTPKSSSQRNNNNNNNIEEEDSSLLDIVTEQRNQFRKRMLELETERDSLMTDIRVLKQDIESLKSDNVNLFEKIRYLQSYNEPAGTPVMGKKTSTHQQNDEWNQNQNNFNNNYQKMNSNQRSELRLTVQGRKDGGGVESKYKNLYEEKINPFSDFNARERRKRYTGLNPMEKLLLRGSNFFLSNKYTRSFLFFYAVALHLLVFMTVFLSSSSVDCYHQAKKNVVLMEHSELDS